jgi:L,D-transpeptidase catalytic domain
MRAALHLLALALVAAGVGASAAALTGAWDGGGSASTRRATAPVAGSFDATGIGAEPAPAFSVPAPQLESGRVARWATVRRPTAARRWPSRAAPVVARVGTRTPEGTANLLLLLRAVRRDGAVWALARLPVLPNDTVGWVEQRALGGSHFVHMHLVVDRVRRRLTLLRDGRIVFAASVGVGTPSAPTPAGEFYVRDRLTTLARSFYGPVAFGTSARSPVLTDWPGGGFVGIHGTSEPQLIPGAVSHGCIRLRNDDVLRLDRLLEIGTPLTIR